MSEIQTVKTAIHEIAHAKLHAINPDEMVAPEERKDRHTNFFQNLADRAADGQRGGYVAQCGGEVDHGDVAPREIVDQHRRGIDGELRAADDEQIGVFDVSDRAVDRRGVEPLAVEHHIGLDDAAGTFGHAVAFEHRRNTVKLPAAHAMVAVNAPVQLEHGLGPAAPMQIVDVLRDDGGELAHPLEPCKRDVRRVRLCVGADEVLFIIIEENIGVFDEKPVAQKFLGRSAKGFERRIHATLGAKIGNPRLGSSFLTPHSANRSGNVLDCRNIRVNVFFACSFDAYLRTNG